MTRRILCAALAAAVLACLCMGAAAHPVPDFTKTGTVRLSFRSGEEVAAGGSVTLYRVGNIEADDGDYIFVLTEEFAASGVSLEDPQAAGVAEQLKKYAQEYSVAAVTLPVDGEGNVTFADLQLGLYLLVQDTPASGWNPAAPFLISVPQLKDGDYVYEIDATPKVELEKTPPAPTEPDGPKLPQTGQLNWPVPVMALCGLLLLIAGCILCVYGRKGKR